jgi:hypothetical protein
VVQSEPFFVTRRDQIVSLGSQCNSDHIQNVSSFLLAV